MPPTKQAAKKAPAKQAGPEQDGKDLRRAYEHLGRVESLRKTSDHDDERIGTLVSLAQRELQAGHAKSAADLLRAAEHFSFALSNDQAATEHDTPAPLKAAIDEEFKRLSEKAQEHWEKHGSSERHSEVAELFQTGVKEAEHASRDGIYWHALELARGVEALAHVKKQGQKHLGSEKDALQLTTA